MIENWVSEEEEEDEEREKERGAIYLVAFDLAPATGMTAVAGSIAGNLPATTSRGIAVLSAGRRGLRLGGR